MKNIIFAAILILAFTALLSVVIAKEIPSDLSVEELKFIAKSMRAVEDSLLNVRIDSNSWVEYGPSASGPWEKTPLCWSTTAFFENISNNHARIDYHKEVGQWENGAAPYFEQRYSVSFDGLKGRRKDISNSYGGNTFDINSGEISSEEPLQFKMCGRITGIAASLFFYHRNMPDPFSKRFSVNFEGAADPNYFMSAFAASNPKYLNVKPRTFKVVFEKLEGIECIKGSYTRDSLRQEWWFDPNRGFALLKFNDLRKDKDGNEQVYSSINVTKLKEVAKDIWWPMEAYFIDHSHEKDKPWKRIVYQASNVIVNAPNFDSKVFALTFPKGYRVDDKVAEKTYVVDANLAMIAEPNYSPEFKTIRIGDTQK
jgi:hypothetical protein